MIPPPLHNPRLQRKREAAAPADACARRFKGYLRAAGSAPQPPTGGATLLEQLEDAVSGSRRKCRAPRVRRKSFVRRAPHRRRRATGRSRVPPRPAPARPGCRRRRARARPRACSAHGAGGNDTALCPTRRTRTRRFCAARRHPHSVSVTRTRDITLSASRRTTESGSADKQCGLFRAGDSAPTNTI